MIKTRRCAWLLSSFYIIAFSSEIRWSACSMSTHRVFSRSAKAQRFAIRTARLAPADPQTLEVPALRPRDVDAICILSPTTRSLTVMKRSTAEEAGTPARVLPSPAEALVRAPAEHARWLLSRDRAQSRLLENQCSCTPVLARQGIIAARAPPPRAYPIWACSQEHPARTSRGSAGQSADACCPHDCPLVRVARTLTAPGAPPIR